MEIGESHYKTDIENCNICSEQSEFLLGRCYQCITGLHLTAYNQGSDTDNFFWKDETDSWDGGQWEKKNNYTDVKFDKKEHFPFGNPKDKPFVYYVESG